MELNRHYSERGANASVVLKKVYPSRSDTSLDESDTPVHCELYSAFNETLLFQVHQVVHAISLAVPLQVIRRVTSARIEVAQLFEKSTLQLPIQFHMSGLRGLFVWKQKATTDAPDTHSA